MRVLRAAILSGFAALIPTAGRAADATPEQAQAITREYERYLGHPAPGAPPVVYVTPQGDAYLVDLDLKVLAAPLEKFGFVLDSTRITFQMEPRSDGLWQVSQNVAPAIGLKLPNGVMSMRFGSVSFDGVYDPNLLSFVQGTSDIEDLKSDSTSSQPNGPTIRMLRSTAKAHGEFTGRGLAPGVVSVSSRQTMTDTTQHVSMTLPAATATSQNPMEFDLGLGSVDADVTLDAFRVRALLDLWAWLVAHPSIEAIQANQEELRPLVRVALPLFDQLAVTGNMKDIGLDAALGHFGVASGSFGLGFNGIAQRGSFSEKVAFSGLQIPAGLLPAFTAGLVPKDLAFEVNVSGYDAASVADLVLANVDLTATPPVKPEIAAQVAQKALPDGFVTISLGHGRIASDLAEIGFEGEMKVGPARRPTGSGVISVKGLDAIVKALSDAAQTDTNARNAVMGLSMARGFGQPGPDGSTVWRIEVGEDGRPVVNGIPLGPAPAK